MNQTAEFENFDDTLIQMIRHRARELAKRYRFRSSDRQDLAQELTLHVLKIWRKFGHQVKDRDAFLSKVLSRHAITLVRRYKAKKRNDQAVVSLSDLVENEGEEAELGDTLLEEVHDFRLGSKQRPGLEQQALVADVATVLAKLPPHLRDLCQRLQKQTVAEIARDTGVPPTTLHDHIQRLREIFTEAGLQNYL